MGFGNFGRSYGKQVKGGFLAWVHNDFPRVHRYSHRSMESFFQPHAASKLCAIIAFVIKCMRVLVSYNRMAA